MRSESLFHPGLSLWTSTLHCFCVHNADAITGTWQRGLTCGPFEPEMLKPAISPPRTVISYKSDPCGSWVAGGPTTQEVAAETKRKWRARRGANTKIQTIRAA